MTNLLLVSNFLCECANVGMDFKQTKNFAVAAQLIDEGAAMAAVDWKALPEEAKNYDADALDKAIREKLDFSDDELEAKVEKIVSAVLKIGALGLDLYDVFKPSEKEESNG